MSALLLWLAAPEWERIVAALLHSLWQAGAIALLLILALQRVASPAWRYRLALGSLGGVLLALFTTWAVLNQRATPQFNPPSTPAQTLITNFQPGHPTDASEPLIFNAAPVRQQSVTTGPVNWIAWMALLWLTGALLMLVRAGIQVAGAERLRRSGRPLADVRIAQLLAEAQRAVRLARQIRVTVTDTLTSPAVVGVLVPTLILPLSLMTTLTHEQLRFVLLHELAHIRRGDYFANLFQLFAEALLFFNPAVWWISHQVRREREACCDALAIELSGAPADYVRTLVQVAESALVSSPAAASAFGDKQRGLSSLSDRVQRLLVPGYRPTLRLTWRAMLISLVVGGTLLVLSALGTRTTVGAVLADGRKLDPLMHASKTNSQVQPATNDVAGPVTLLSTEWDRYDSRGEALVVDASQAVSSTHPTNNVRFNSDYLVQSARLLLEAGKMDEAEAKLKSALEMYLENPAAFYYLSYIKESRYRNAKRGQVVEVSRDGSDGEQTDAGKLYSRRFKVDPHAFEQSLGIQWVNGAWWIPSKTNAHEGFIEAVQTSFKKVGVELKPPKTIWYHNRSGEMLVRATQVDLDRLTDFLAEFSGASPKTKAATHVQNVRLLMEAGQFSEAEAQLEQALKLDPENQAAKYYQAYAAESGYPARPATGPSVQTFQFLEGVLNYDAGENQVLAAPSIAVDALPAPSTELRELKDKVPVLGDLPLIGKLFRSNSNGQSGAAEESDQLHTRRYRVDPNTFMKNLAGTTAHEPAPTNVLSAVRKFFANFGVKLDPPKNVYFKDRAGELLVRATLQDLDSIEDILQVVNAPAMQVNIKVRFVEVDSQNGFGWLMGNLLTATNSSTKDFPLQFSGILTDPQYRVVLRAMEERKDAEVLAMQEVTTSSGQQAQIQTVELRTVVNGMNLPLPALPGHATTNTSTNLAYQTQVLPFGAVLDVIPFIAADGHTIQMTLLPSVTEFLGYDDPGEFLIGSRKLKSEAQLPLPRTRLRQMSMSANVWDGQTLFLGTASEEIVSKKADGNIDRNVSRDAKKQLLIFITPTIIDQGGNRMRDGSELPADGDKPVPARR